MTRVVWVNQDTNGEDSALLANDSRHGIRRHGDYLTHKFEDAKGSMQLIYVPMSESKPDTIEHVQNFINELIVAPLDLTEFVVGTIDSLLMTYEVLLFDDDDLSTDFGGHSIVRLTEDSEEDEL
jgi:hypothetical protein